MTVSHTQRDELLHLARTAVEQLEAVSRVGGNLALTPDFDRTEAYRILARADAEAASQASHSPALEVSPSTQRSPEEILEAERELRARFHYLNTQLRTIAHRGLGYATCHVSAEKIRRDVERERQQLLAMVDDNAKQGLAEHDSMMLRRAAWTMHHSLTTPCSLEECRDWLLALAETHGFVGPLPRD